MSLKHKSSLLFGVSLLGTFGLLSLLTATLQAQTIKIGGTGAALGTMQALAEAFNESPPRPRSPYYPVWAVAALGRLCWEEPSTLP